MTVELCPPNPNELEIATFTGRRFGLVRNVVEIAVRILVLEIDRGGHDVIASGEDAGGGFDRAGRAEAVAGHRLGGRDGELVGVRAEHSADGPRLGRVADVGGRTVGVDVVNILGADAGSR